MEEDTAQKTETEAAPSETEALTLEAALSLLARTRPAAVLSLLRDPDFALISVQAFAGFRVNAQGFSNPIVRRRLALEATRHEKFAEKLGRIAEETPAAASITSAASPPAPGLPNQSAEAESKRTERFEALRAERDRRRRERDEARNALSSVETSLNEAEQARRRAEEERDALQRQMQAQTQRLARLERQVSKLQSEQAVLLRSLRQEKTAESFNETAFQTPAALSFSPPTPAVSPWQTAVMHLLNKGRYELVLALAEDVLRTDFEETGALEIAAQAHQARNEPREAALYLRRRLMVALGRGVLTEAADTAFALAALMPRQSDVTKDLRRFFTALRGADAAIITHTRNALDRLRGLSAETYTWLTEMINAIGPDSLTAALLPTPGILGIEDKLPLPLPAGWTPLTAQRLQDALIGGDVQLIETVRNALDSLRQENPETYQQVLDTVQRAAGGDESYLRPLRRAPRGPVIIDGSNVAWFDQESLAAGRPRLRPILEVRRALRHQGYFPVVLFGDAPLPYTIDDPTALREMLCRHEITLVDSGVDADEVLLREAKRLHAPLVTNDYMADWDPNGEVPKIRYTISLSGIAHLIPPQS